MDTTIESIFLVACTVYVRYNSSLCIDVGISHCACSNGRERLFYYINKTAGHAMALQSADIPMIQSIAPDVHK